MSASRIIKFFLSSTFLDFQQERDALQQNVFPRLKALCAKKGFQFQPVDLRWGVEKEVIENNQAIDFCLNEVERCISHPQPSMLILVGQRYGWVPIPTSIPQETWRTIIQHLTTEDAALLRQWYVVDHNDVTPHFYLQEKRSASNWPETEEKLRALFGAVANDVHNLPSEYQYSATEREIRHALTNDTVNSVVFSRDFLLGNSHPELISEPQSEIESLTRLKTFIKDNQNAIQLQAKVDLNEYLHSRNDSEYGLSHQSYKGYSNYLRKFCEAIYHQFKRIIIREIEAFEKLTPVAIELAEQEKIKSKKAQTVIGRERETQSIVDFAHSETDIPFYLLYGKSGIGKSCIMAKAIERLQADSSFITVYRFLGGSEQSNTLSRALRSITTQLFPDKPARWSVSSTDDVVKRLVSLLSRLTESPKVILFIDGLDQTPDFESEVHELIASLPNNVKLVLSVADETHNAAIDYLSILHHTPHKLAVTSLNDDQTNIVINTLLRQKGRTLTPKQRFLVEKQCANKSTLFIDLACKIAMHWKSDKDYGSEDLGQTEQQLLRRFLNTLTHEKYHKPELMAAVLGNLSAAKTGLSQLELLEIISENAELINKFNSAALSVQKLSRLPDAFFSRLYDDLKDLFTEVLIDDELLIRPAHTLLAEVMKKEFYELDKRQYHQNLIDYFSTTSNRKRKARELSWSLFCLNDSQGLYNVLSDIENFGLLFEVYVDEMEVLRYVNFLRSAFPKYQEAMTSRFVSEFARPAIDNSAVEFLERVSLLGENALLYKPMTVLTKRGIPFENMALRNRYKIIQLQAKANCEESNNLHDVIEEAEILLHQLNETDEQYFDVSLLVTDLYRASGRHQFAIELCETWLNNKAGTDEQNETFHELVASIYKHEMQSDKALKHYQIALDLKLKRQGRRSIGMAITQGNKAGVFRQQGQLDQALRHLKPAIDTLEKALGPNERRLAAFYNSLGYIQLFRSLALPEAEKHATLISAQRCYEKAIDIATFWNSHQGRMAYLQGLIQVLQIQQKFEHAFKALHKLLCIYFTTDTPTGELLINNQDYTQVLATMRNQLKASVSVQHYVAIERDNLDELQAQLGTRHEFFLSKKLELVYLYLQIEERQQAFQQFEELEQFFSTFMPEQKRAYKGYSELQNRFYLPVLMQALEGGYFNVEQGDFEAALSLFEKAHALEKKLGLTTKKGYEGVFSTLSLLSTKYVNSRQISLALRYTKRYYDMLKTDLEFGEHHPRTLQVEAILGILQQQSS